MLEFGLLIISYRSCQRKHVFSHKSNMTDVSYALNIKIFLSGKWKSKRLRSGNLYEYKFRLSKY